MQIKLVGLPLILFAWCFAALCLVIFVYRILATLRLLSRFHAGQLVAPWLAWTAVQTLVCVLAFGGALLAIYGNAVSIGPGPERKVVLRYVWPRGDVLVTPQKDSLRAQTNSAGKLRIKATVNGQVFTSAGTTDDETKQALMDLLKNAQPQPQP